jgi:hypothetical protein
VCVTHKSLLRPPTYALSVDIGVCVYDLWKLWGDAPSCQTLNRRHPISGALTSTAWWATDHAKRSLKLQTAPRAEGSLL